MKNCISCGIPLTKQEEIGAKAEKGHLCIHCVDEQGNIKNCQEIFNGGIEFFMSVIPGTEKDLAEKITRKNMNMQLYWQKSNEKCLQGEEATDEEFQNTLSKLKM